MKRYLTYIMLLFWLIPVQSQIPDNQIGSDQEVFSQDPVDFDMFMTDELGNEEAPLIVQMYPVPVQDYLVVRLSCRYTLHNVRITVLDRQGYQVFGMRGEEMGPGTKRVVIPFEELPAGNYYIWIQYEEGMVTRQVIRQ
ncbi:MAG: hypothetical protein H6548_01725 [Chitinophagales bacterium]|nr:hypothetical protein [Chitinophagales bacterium]MCB9020813.1 hypothetical protein [Chitinophagales bacterium]HAE14812.1 hypothetical protein [Bacteroidota bacterium]HPE97223.1 hypothetical protein [Chitinophagales bacterium]HQU40704.1 hypothetical protein [Chitinophagales bacterium]